VNHAQDARPTFKPNCYRPSNQVSVTGRIEYHRGE
jgi:hypothetical protein